VQLVATTAPLVLLPLHLVIAHVRHVPEAQLLRAAYQEQLAGREAQLADAVLVDLLNAVDQLHLSVVQGKELFGE